MSIKMVVLLAIIISCSASANNDDRGLMKDFMGINIHMHLWMDHLQSGGSANPTFTPYIPFKWVRLYAPWRWFEGDKDEYRFNTDSWRNLDSYLTSLNDRGVNVLACILSPPDWVNSGRLIPLSYGDGTESDHYRDKAEYLAQFTARYGSKSDHPAGNLKTADKVAGLNLVRYVESGNETNEWWGGEENAWYPDMFGAYLNAAHDGQGVSMEQVPIAGIKQGDPNAIHVLPGLVGNGFEPLPQFHTDGNYLPQTHQAAGRQAYDVLNIHGYFSNRDFGGHHGVSPEYFIYEQDNSFFEDVISWRDQNAPGIPIWLTEFGWDSHVEGSFIYVGDGTEDQRMQRQSNYLMRSFALFKRIGLDKAFIFWDKDENTLGTVQFMSCGIIKDKNNYGYERKTAYYNLTTMQNAIGDHFFDGVIEERQGAPERYLFRFKKSESHYTIMGWVRNSEATGDQGAIIENHTLSLPQIEECVMITPAPDSEDGVEQALTITNPGTEHSSVTIPQLSETPRFFRIAAKEETSVHDVRVSQVSVVGVTVRGRTLTINNPFDNMAKVTFVTPLGRVIDAIHISSGVNTVDVTLAPGVYFLNMVQGRHVKVHQVLIK